jgi:GNAT superfamily N-acetyltransferase
MYVLAEFRGRGLGRLLLETALQYGREHGCRRIRAWSDVKLTGAHRLYLKAGFVQQGERICDDPDQSREYGFWKEPL